MKSRIIKIWGLVLTVAILAGLLVPVTPVSAGANAWTSVNTPSSLKYQIVPGGDIDFFLAAADGMTMFVYDNDNGVAYKSTDGAVTWTKSTALKTKLTDNGGTTVVAMAISPNYASDKSVVAADEDGKIYLSVNGGVSYYNPFAISGATILSLAIVPGPDGNIILVGTDTTMYVWGQITGLQNQGTLTANALPDGKVIAVAASPDYAVDSMLLALVANSTTNKTILYANDGGGWNTIYPGIEIGASAATRGVIAFAADFDSSSNAHVLIGTNNDLYRATIGGSAVDLSGTTPTYNVYSIAVSGNIADGKAYIGLDDGTVKKVTGLTGTATFASSTKGTIGTNAKVALGAGGKVYAATGGAGSAVYVSNDDIVSFDLLSLISITGTSLVYNDLAVVNDNTMFLWAEDTASYNIVFKTVDAGATWLGIYNVVGEIAGVYPSPAYATDNTVYIAKPPTAPVTINRVLKSTNGGSTFTSRNVVGTDFTAFAALDANTSYYGISGGSIYKTGRSTPFGSVTGVPTSIMVISASDIYVATDAGNVYRSTDDAVTFTAVGASLGAGAVALAKDPNYATNSTIFAATADGKVSSFVVGTSTAWTELGNPSAAAVTVPSLALSSDGNLYVADADEIGRALNPNAVADKGWDKIAGPSATAVIKTIDLTDTVVNPTTTDHNIYAIVNDTTDSIKVFTDKMTGAAAVTAPAAGSSVNKDTSFTWAAYPAATKYDVQIALDNQFINKVYDSGAYGLSGTLLPNPTVLVPGTQYYWRVRVHAGSPLLSNWSATTAFLCKLTQSGNDLLNLLAPNGGATNVPLKPTFQWSPINGATGYDLQVSDNPVFVNPIDSQTNLATTVWTLTKTLENNKVYYWRVRAVNSNTGVVGDWVANTFTTLPVPASPTPPVTTTATATVTVTPAPKFFDANSGLYFNTEADRAAYQAAHPPVEDKEATPAYIWVIIAIGAVLVIAVIVLIARTRRV